MANSVTPLLNADEIKLTRLRQLTDVFAMADSTLAGHRVTCEVMGGSQSGNNSPAWSQGGKITFNSDAITEVSTVEGLVKVNGLNYHELAHILYTPSGGDLVRMVNSNGWYTAFNVLEDQRIETLLVAKYPTVAPYLVATVAEYFMETNPATHGNAWPYLVGRAYLPASMRDYFEAASKTDPKMRSTMMLAGQIVGEYKFMDVNSGNKRVRALELIEKFHNIIGTHQQFSPFGHERATQAAQGGSAPGTGPRNGSAAAQAAEQNRKDEIQDAADKEAAGDTGAPGAEGESGSEGGEGGDSPKDGAQGEGDSDTDGEGGAGAGSGSGITTPKPSDTAKVKEMLKAAGDQAKMTPTVADDVRRQREAMSMGKRFRGTLPAPTRSESPVSDEAKRVANQFGKQLARLVAQSDPGFHTHRSSGRVNVQRAMHGSPLDEVFDEWDSGKQDADSIEMVVLLDTSGSMSGQIDAVSQAGWILKRGTESLGGNASVSVIEFSNTSSYVYAPGSSAKRGSMISIVCGGGTRPLEGIREAMRVFHNSTKKRKICLFVSDGSWSEGSYSNRMASGHMSNDEAIQRLNANGVTTAAVHIADSYTTEYVNNSKPAGVTMEAHMTALFGHGCNVFAPITTVDELVLFGKRLVKSALSK